MRFQKNTSGLFSLTVSAIASMACCASFAQSSATNQSLYMSAGTAYLKTLPSGAPQSVTGNLGLGIANNAMTVTVDPAGVVLPGDLILGNVVINSSTNLVVGSSRNTVAGELRTEGQQLEFTLAPNTTSPLVYNALNLAIKDGAGSGKIWSNGLYMGGTETFKLNFQTSLKNGATYRLIESVTPISINNIPGATYNRAESSGFVIDNSYVINSTVALEADGAGDNRFVKYTATRSNDEYITKSATQGHFSNAAARSLGTIAANGYQLGDLATAINTLDIDTNGFGNTQQNLAVQAKRLAPVANNSYVMSVLAVGDLINSVVDYRLLSLRRETPARDRSPGKDMWAQTFARDAKQSGVDDYDGYRLKTAGFAAGFDRSLGDLWYGVAWGHAMSGLSQTGFRAGDGSTIQSDTVKLYATTEFNAMYAEGSIGLGRHSMSGTRTTAINRIAQFDTSFTSQEMQFGMGYRLRLKDPGTTVTPYANVTQTRLKQPGYTEASAGDLGLVYQDESVTRSRFTAGLRFNTETRWGTVPAFTTLFVARSQDNGLSSNGLTAHYQGPTDVQYTTFTTPVGAVVRDTTHYGASTTLAPTKTSTIVLGLQMEHRQSFNAYSAQAKAIWHF